jgi:hypothetical protein
MNFTTTSRNPELTNKFEICLNFWTPSVLRGGAPTTHFTRQPTDQYIAEERWKSTGTFRRYPSSVDWTKADKDIGHRVMAGGKLGFIVKIGRDSTLVKPIRVYFALTQHYIRVRVGVHCAGTKHTRLSAIRVIFASPLAAREYFCCSGTLWIPTMANKYHSWPFHDRSQQTKASTHCDRVV